MIKRVILSTLLFTWLMDAATRISIVVQPEQTAGQIVNEIVQQSDAITDEISLKIGLKIKFNDQVPAAERTPLLSAVFQQLVQQDRTVIPKITTLDLEFNSLDNRQIQLDLSPFTSLEVLLLDGNALTRLPNMVGLIHLKELWFSNNQLGQQSEPLDFSSLVSLVDLYLTSNALTYLPNLTGLVHLKVLGLGRNQLEQQAEPLDVSSLTSLEELYLHDNALTRFPDLTGLEHLERLWLHDNPGLAGQRLRIPAGVAVYGFDSALIDYYIAGLTTVGDERLLTNLDEFRLTASLLLTAHTWLTDDDIAPIVARVQAQFAAQGNHVSVAELKRWLEEDELVQRHTQPVQVMEAVENAAQNLELFDVATSDDDRPVFLSRSTLMGLQTGRRYFNPLNRQPILPVGKARNLAAAWLYWHAIRDEDGSYKHPIGAQYFDALARQEDPVALAPFTVATITAMDYLKARGLNDAQSSVILRDLPKYERNFVLVTDLLDAVAQQIQQGALMEAR